MTDFAKLIMTADASGLKQGEQALDSLAAKGEQTETRVTKSTGNLSKEFDRVVTAISGVTDAQNRANSIAGQQVAALQKLIDQTQGLASAATQAQAPLSALQGEISQVGQEAQNTGKIYAAVNQMFTTPGARATAMQAQIDALTGISRAASDAQRSAAAFATTFATQVHVVPGRAVPAAKSVADLAGRMDDAAKSARNFGPQIQNASYQVGDFFVQIASGTDATRALAQQMPQLLGAFGVFGAVAGAAVAIGGALIPMFLNGGREAEKFEDIMEDLAAAMKTYEESTDAANSGTMAMIEKFGLAAPRAREMYEALALMSRLEAIDKIASGLSKVIPAFADVTSLVRDYDAEINDANAMIREGAVAAVEDLKDRFGLTVDQARALADAVDAAKLAKGPAETAEAARDIVAALIDAQRAGADLPPELRNAVTEAANLTISADQLVAILGDAPVVLSDATAATDDWAAAMAAVNAQLAGAYSLISAIGGGMVQRAGISAASAVLDAGGTAIAAEKARRRAEEKQRFLNEANTAEGFRSVDMIDAELAEKERQWAEEDQYEERLNAVRERDRAASRKSRGGAKKSKKGNPDRENEYERGMWDIQAQTKSLLEQADAIAKVVAAGGDWERAVAVVEKEQKLLNDAQKAGITINDNVKKDIREMAEAYVDAEEKMEAVREQQDRIREATEQGQDAMKDLFGSILEGADSAKEALANLLLQIAQVQFAKAALGLLGGTEWGAKLIQDIGALSSWDGGGYTWDGSRTGGVDGKGGRVGILHPNETVIDHTKGQQAGGGHVSIGFDRSTGSLTAAMYDVAGNVVAQASSSIEQGAVKRAVRMNRKSSRYFGK